MKTLNKTIKNKDLIRTRAYINAKWVSHPGNNTFSIFNPFNQEQIAELSDSDAEMTIAAIESAEKAFKHYKKTSPGKRAKLLKNWFRLILENKEDLAQLLTLEQGKAIKEARGEILYGASFIEWYAEEARRTYGDVIPPFKSDVRITCIKQPVGVVAAITPWNFPIAMITRKIAPALAAGCTVVVKPSEETPLSALALAHLAEKAGFPPGVINIIPTNNPSEVGLELCTNPKVRKLSFTGSTEVGKLLMKQCSSTVKKISLELGGNAPFIVFDSADIHAAVEGAITSKYRNSGQTCICANRIYVQKSIAHEFIAALKDASSKLVSGNGLEEETDIGPLINSEACQKINRLINNAIDNGAKIISGSDKMVGSLCEPIIISNLDSSMDIHNEEIFGPISALYTFESEEEVISLANDTNYGLAAYFYGKEVTQIWRVAEALEYGMVGINTSSISSTVAPFGGVKESGLGKEGSKYGMDEFMELKYMCWGNIK